ncbi:MAG: ABC transporter permease [Calditrichia bacterium]
MTGFFENLKEIFQYLRQYKSRTFMTMFGIIWGTMTVILLLAFGVGIRDQLSKNMHGIGEGIAIVWPGSTSIPFEGYGKGRRIRLTPDDIEYIRTQVKGIRRISPEMSQRRATIRVADKRNQPNLTGIIPEYGPMRNIWPEEGGRWLNEADLKERRRVIFLGNRLRDFLFGENANAIGKYVYVNDAPFLVVGVMRKKTQSSSYNQRDRDRAFIPITTFQAMFGQTYVENFVYQLKDPRQSEAVQEQLFRVLGKKMKFDPKDKETLGIWDTTEMDKFLFYFSLGFNLFMGGIGTITLIVGGIGLANIMYVIVQERTREIGIRRSVGARSRHIMGQFLLETFIIIGSSAFIGFVLAWGIIQLVAAIPSQGFKEVVGVPHLNGMVAVVTVLILGSIGFLAGFFPARRAAHLNVVDCLRY